MESSNSEDEEVPLSETVLKLARNGETEKLEKLCQKNVPALPSILNTPGRSKANRDWSPMMLAAYFGHYSTVEFLIKSGADILAVNDKGESALHKSAFIGRLDIVTLLLSNGADVNNINVEGRTALQVARTEDVREIIKAAQITESTNKENNFLKAVTQGNLSVIEELIRVDKTLNFNCTDEHGNTALHLSAMKNHVKIAAYLMQAGLKSMKNKKDQLPSDLAVSDNMKKVLSVTPINDLRKTVQRFEGRLLKKTKLFGFQPKYVVLDRGVLTVFSTLADASSGTKRRTYKYLDDAQCLVQSKDNLGIAMVYNTGSSHIFRVDPAYENPVIMRQKWVNAIRNHIAYSTHYMHKGTMKNEDSDDDIVPLSSMNESLQTAKAHQTSLEKEVAQLSQLVSRMAAIPAANLSSTHQGGSLQGSGDVLGKSVAIASSSREMCNVLQHCLTLLSQQDQLRSQQLEEEKERCRVLQESLRVLAVQNYELECHVIPGSESGYQSPLTIMDDDRSDSDEFYDCDAISNDHDLLAEGSVDDPQPSNAAASTRSITCSGSDLEYNSKSTDFKQVQSIHKHTCKARTQLPVPMISRSDFSVWSVLKQCIGKELSKITMPVVFNEPISFLQRLTEYMEYGYLLERAILCESPTERMQYVAAFAISASASNWDRLGKPFNPLLGETYELDRPELGFKVVCEQVSHHPPVSAFHASSDEFRFYGTVNPKLKFWGKSVEISPKGMITLELLRHGETYTWENVNGSVHNIIIGKLWMEHHGRMEIINHKTGHKADINFKKSSMFSKDIHRVEGFITDGSGERVSNLYGSWTDSMFAVSAASWDESLQIEKKSKHLDGLKRFGKSLSLKDDEIPEEVPKRLSTFNQSLSNQTFLWQADIRSETADKYYSFTDFALMLNELSADMQSKLPPTDSRLRPDIRSLENGNIDEAAEKKVALEEKQRATRKIMKKEKQEWSPRWFLWTKHPVLDQNDWIYQGHYWKRSWSNCPDIFLQ